jgi:hypothetical protein
MSADASGLQSGCKEASGSLKDMKQDFGRVSEEIDGKGFDWKGMKKSARSLKFVGREMGGMIKGGLGDVIGIAATGAAMGPAGAALAAGAVGMKMLDEHQQQITEDRANALHTMRESSRLGISADSYSSIKGVAGDDTKFLDDMAGAMKKLQDEGPNASEALKQLGRDIQGLDVTKGIGGKEGEDLSRERKVAAVEKMLTDQGVGPDTATGGYLGYDDKSLRVMKQKLNLSDEEMGKFSDVGSGGRMSRRRSLFGFDTGEDVYKGHMADLYDKMSNDQDSVRKRTEQLSREHAASGMMAGAMEQGGSDAWSVIANSQMASAKDSDPVVSELRETGNKIVNAIQHKTPDFKSARGGPN